MACLDVANALETCEVFPHKDDDLLTMSQAVKKNPDGKPISCLACCQVFFEPSKLCPFCCLPVDSMKTALWKEIQVARNDSYGNIADAVNTAIEHCIAWNADVESTLADPADAPRQGYEL